MSIHTILNATPLKCPYCKIPMNLNCGNPGFSYWSCEICNKEFEFHIQTEQFTDEINRQLPLFKYSDNIDRTCRGKRKLLPLYWEEE